TVASRAQKRRPALRVPLGRRTQAHADRKGSACMNLPGVDTYVCDASATKDADARGSQICPLPDGRRKSPIGTKRTFYACRRMSVLGGRAVMQRTSPQRPILTLAV